MHAAERQKPDWQEVPKNVAETADVTFQMMWAPEPVLLAGSGSLTESIHNDS